MPFYLPPINRRRFLAAAGLTLLPGGLRLPLAWAGDADPHSLALVADTHIAADRKIVVKNVNMAAHLTEVVKDITALKELPAVGLVVGDLAQKNGQAGDYAAFADLLKPLRDAGMPIHLTLGNHDHRDRFIAAMKIKRERPDLQKLVEVISMERANLFVVDTLDLTDSAPGSVGAAQLAWLTGALDARASKPAIVFAHHDPILEAPPKGKKPSGLLDTEDLFHALAPRRQVKALIFGHTHDWSVKEHPSGIHLVNLPPTSYVFTPGRPSGWVKATLRADGAKLELRCPDPKDAKWNTDVELNWRN